MLKNCRDCFIELNEEIRAKAGKNRISNLCKKCDNKKAYTRKISRGMFKDHPCEFCGNLCKKRTSRAFCSLRCRILGNIEKGNDCWIWRGKKNIQGYGEIMIDGKRTRLTRIVYKLFKGYLQDGLFVCHTCDNPSCVNPDHLWKGTNSQNQKDRVEKIKKGLIPFRIKLRDANGRFCPGWGNY